MIGIKWYADFKEGPATTDRRKWDDKRDLVVEFDAVNKEHARSRAFELAYEHGMTAPFLGTLKEIGIEEMRKGQKKVSTSPAIISFLQGRAGKSTSIEQIIKETGFTSEQIRSALAHFRSKRTGNIETLIIGNLWRWIDDPQEASVGKAEPTPEPAEQPIEFDDEKGFYQIGVARDDAYVILQKDSDGTIWKAVQL